MTTIEFNEQDIIDFEVLTTAKGNIYFSITHNAFDDGTDTRSGTIMSPEVARVVAMELLEKADALKTAGTKMTVKYELKDRELLEKLCSIFPRFCVDLQIACTRDFDDGCSYISFITTGKGLNNIGAEIKVEKTDIEKATYYENVVEYDPSGWNKYPDIKPPKPGDYAVTFVTASAEVFKGCARYTGRGWELSNLIDDIYMSDIKEFAFRPWFE